MGVVRENIKNYLFKFFGVLVAVVMVVYLLPPVNFASAVGYVTWRNVDMSNASPGFTEPTVTTAPSPATSGTTMTVSSSAGYPTPPFVVTIGGTGTTAQEAVEVNTVSGTSWTLTRGYGGTTAQAISAGNYISGPDTMGVSFVPATPATGIQAIIIDFCTDSPLYNSSTCTTPSGMYIGPTGATSIAVGSITGIPSAIFNTTYSKANNSSRNDIIISDNTTSQSPQAAGSIGAGATGTGSIGQSMNITVSATNEADYPTASTSNPDSWFYVSAPSTGETMQVTNVSGTTWTVTRGALGSCTGSCATIAANAALSQPPIQFDLYGVMNPTSAGVLYARIYTYSTYSTASAFSSASPVQATGVGSYSNSAGANIDAGGVALEIVSVLTITAKVQEYLQFCIYTASGTTTGCNLGGNSIALGNTSGILSIAAAYVDSETRFDVATNASGYVAISFTGSPLANGSLLIENSTASGTGATATTAYASAVGTDQFGLCAAAASSQPTNWSTTNLSFPNSAYPSTNCPAAYGVSATYGGSATFGLNIAQAGSVYGDLLAIQKSGAEEQGVISFLGNIAPAQLAGIYTTTFNFVASGTY